MEYVQTLVPAEKAAILLGVKLEDLKKAVVDIDTAYVYMMDDHWFEPKIRRTLTDSFKTFCTLVGETYVANDTMRSGVLDFSQSFRLRAGNFDIGYLMVAFNKTYEI